METVAQKADFLRTEFTRQLGAIDPATKPAWGKMNVQQMVEHMSGAMRVANGKSGVNEILTPAENIARMQAFVQSEKPFRENTPNALLPDDPTPVKHATMADALAELQSEIDDFFAYYEGNPGVALPNPFFGELDFDLQVQLLYKHAIHHLKQFGVA